MRDPAVRDPAVREQAVPGQPSAGGTRSPRSHEASAVLAAALTGRRRVVHSVITPDTPVRVVRGVHAAGSDLTTIRVGHLAGSESGDDQDAAIGLVGALAAGVAALGTGLRIEGLAGDRFVTRAIDAGATYIAGGPLRSLARPRPAGSVGTVGADVVAESIAAFAAIDRACARPGIVREVSAPEVAAPPALLVAHLLADFALAVRHGARHVVLGYPAMGNLVQDVAALRSLRALAPRVAPGLTDGGALELSVTQWSGTRQRWPVRGWAAAGAATMAAGLADAAQVVVVPPAAGDPDSPAAGLVPGVEFTRQMLDMLIDQRLEVSPQVAAECAAIENEAGAALDALGTFGEEDIARAVADGRLLGPSPGSRAGRDALGAVRAVGTRSPGWPVWDEAPALPLRPSPGAAECSNPIILLAGYISGMSRRGVGARHLGAGPGSDQEPGRPYFARAAVRRAGTYSVGWSPAAV